jgi:hypothetical protein
MGFTLKFCTIASKAFITGLAVQAELPAGIQMIFGVQKLTCIT